MSRVVITGAGVVSPAGLGVSHFHEALAAGASYTGPVERRMGGTHRVAGAALGDADLEELRRRAGDHESLAAQMVAEATREAVTAAAWSGPLPVILATVMGTRPALDQRLAGLPDDEVESLDELLAAAEQGAVWARPRAIFDLMVRAGQTTPAQATLISSGCSGGNLALAHAAATVRSGCVPIALAASSDALSTEVIGIFGALKAIATDAVRPFDVHRDGTLPGEGATVFVVEDAEHAERRGVPALAVVEAAAVAADAHSIVAPHPDGRALRHTVHGCLSGSGRQPEQVSWVCAHGTGTRANDATEARVLVDCLGPSVLSSIKGAFGHAQGAAAGLEIAAALWSIATQQVPPTAHLSEVDPECGQVTIPKDPLPMDVDCVLSPAFGFGGTVSTVLLGRPSE